MTLVSTAARSVSSSGALTQLFDSTLGADAATIDTGAAGVAAGFNHLLVYALVRTTDAAVNGSVGFRFNNDSGANYDGTFVLGASTGASGAAAIGQTSIAFGVHGASGDAATASPIALFLPAYAQTSFRKTADFLSGRGDSVAANQNSGGQTWSWRNTAAITRLSITSLSANLLSGSRLTVYGLL